MKKAFILVVIITAALLLLKQHSSVNTPAPRQNQRPTDLPNAAQETSNPSIELKAGEEPGTEYVKTMDASIFIPYWTLSTDQTDIKPPAIQQFNNVTMSNFIYFGITPTADGIDRGEPGYANLARFGEVARGTRAETLLTLRMTNDDRTFEILDSAGRQEKIIDDTVEIAVRNGFDGVVLDLEVHALPTRTMIGQISSFVKRLRDQTRQHNLLLYQAIFSDTFYRARPFDIARLSSYVDGFLIMAYDFHKSLGTPGPNFPLGGQARFGYDYEYLLADFLERVPPDKLTVVFGMYGWDWPVDVQDRPITRAKALTLNQIRKRFLDGCALEGCRVKRDQTSSETTVRYTDKSGSKHIVWFEDEASVAKKIDYARARGIAHAAFWAWGYY